MTPRPTQRSIPSSPFVAAPRQAVWWRLTTLMRPSAPVRHFCPCLNQRFFCSRLRVGLLVERFGTQTRRTPFVAAAASLAAE